MATTLSYKEVYVCEKPNQARDLASVMGFKTKNNGHYTDGTNAITWVSGHFVGFAEPDAYGDQYKRWDLQHLPIKFDNWKIIPTQKSPQFSIVCSLIKGASTVVISTDADREGEFIGREMTDYCKFKGPIKRLLLKSLDDASIKIALNNIIDANERVLLYRAALTRSKCDWMLGMNVTRALTVTSGYRTGLGTLIYGRVQTPTAMLVHMREQAILNFKPKDHYDLSGLFKVENGEFRAKWNMPKQYTNEEGELVDLVDEDNQCLNKAYVQKVADAVSGQNGTITSYDKTRKKTAPPLPLDLKTLQIEAGKKWGYGADQILAIGQSLYDVHKIVTYPRGESRYLPEVQHNEAPERLAAIAKNWPGAGALINVSDSSRKSAAFNDKESKAHEAICPNASVKPNIIDKLTTEESNIYQLICQYYIAQFMVDYEFDSSKIEVSVPSSIGEQTFTARGNVPMVTGWKVAISSSDKKGEDLPLVAKGDSAQCIQGELQSKRTKPPQYYTETSLLADMNDIGKFVEGDKESKAILKESMGIGTPATQGPTISGLIKKGIVVTFKKGKHTYLKMSERGAVTMRLLPDILTSPVMTAKWEKALRMIEEGTLTEEDFLAKQTAFINSIIDKVKSGELVTDYKPKHPCPLCGSALIRRKSGKDFFWGCGSYPTCNHTAPDDNGKPGKAIPRQPAKETDIDCPKCKSTKLVERVSKKNALFFACPSRECDHMQWPDDGKQDQVTDQDCPSCGKGKLVIKTIRSGKNEGKTFKGCSEYPKCKHTEWD